MSLGFMGALLLILAMCLALPQSYAQAETVDAFVEGTFYADDMQAALDRVNEIRKEACDEGLPDPRDTTKNLSSSDYVPIKWSKDLEEIARQRAAEACVLTDHVRPDGSRWYTAKSSNGVSTSSENIAWNWTNNSSAVLKGIEQWYSEKHYWADDKDQANGGHYFALIYPDFNYIALGCFNSTCGKYRSTVSGEFSRSTSLAEGFMPSETKSGRTISVDTENISGIAIDTSACTNSQLTVGDSAQLTAKASLSFDTQLGKSTGTAKLASATWNVINTNLSVSSTGEAIGNSAGECTVTAEAAGKTGTATLTVNRAQDSIVFDTDTEVTKLVHDPDFAVSAHAASGNTVQYRSTDVDVATVDSNGNVTITGAGTTTIEAFTNQSNVYEAASASTTLTVNKRDAELQLSSTTQEAVYGDEPFALEVTRNTSFSTAELSYSSNNAKVATVDSNGNVTITGAGTATITVTSLENKDYLQASATLTLTVGKKDATVSLEKDTYTATYGDPDFKLNASTDADDNSPSFTFASSDTNVATVDENGTVHIVKPGTCEISVTSQESANYKASAPASASLTVAKGNASIDVASELTVEYGDKVELGASVDKGQLGLEYASSDKTIATVDEDGTITAVKPGTCTITVTLPENDYFASTSKNVMLAVGKKDATVSLEEDAYTATYGDPDFKLNASTDADDNSPSFTFASSDTNVATVDENGTVHIVKPGTCTITVTLPENDYFASTSKNVTLTVGKKSIELITERDETNVSYGIGEWDLGDEVVPYVPGLGITYTSSDPSVATIDDKGHITVVGIGTTVLTAYFPGDDYYTEASGTTKVTVRPGSQSISVGKTSYTAVNGDKPFSLKASAKTALTYTSSNSEVATVDSKGNVSVTGPGTCTITIKAASGLYASASKTVTITVSPKANSLSKLKAGKKSFKATWKKSTSSNADGYQIRWSTSKKMSKAKSVTVKGYKASSKTIKKLKSKKRYYVQVRVYKKANGKTYYSGWSKAKYVKVK